MSGLRLAGAMVLAGLATAGIVAGSRFPWRASPEGVAAIRLSWRSVSAPIEECRRASAEELAALPPHMRREEICERRHAPFRLEVAVDGVPVRSALLEPAGASGDRPLYVFEELRVAPGVHRLALRLAEERGASDLAATPRTLDAELSLEPGEVALVSLDANDQLALVPLRR